MTSYVRKLSQILLAYKVTNDGIVIVLIPDLFLYKVTNDDIVIVLIP